MTQRRRAAVTAFALLAGAALAGMAPAGADPTDSADPTPVPVTTTPVAPPPPPPVSNNPMTPHQPPVPVDPAAATAPGAPAPAAAAPLAPGELPPVPKSSVPPVQNPNPNSGGILGSIIDLWHQARNPVLGPGEGLDVPARPPGAGPAAPLPPGYVSINSPGSETPSTSTGGSAPANRPALPPGYYPLTGPPPPWYLDPAAPAPGS